MYYAVIVGKGDYTGKRRFSFEVFDPYKLTYADLEVKNVILTDGTATPWSRVLDPTKAELELGTDYGLVYLDSMGNEVSSITKPGSYQAYAKPGSNGKYKGKTYTCSFTVFSPNDISEENRDWDGYLSPRDIELGSETVPVPRIYRNTYDENDELLEHIELVEGKDFYQASMWPIIKHRAIIREQEAWDSPFMIPIVWTPKWNLNGTGGENSKTPKLWPVRPVFRHL